MLTKIYPYILSLSVVKRIALRKTYLQILYLFLSIQHYLVEKKNLRFLKISSFVIITLIVLSLLQGRALDKNVIIKWGQLYIMISLIPFVGRLFLDNINKITLMTLWISSIEAIAGNIIGYAKFVNVISGISIPRIQGIAGEPNYSGLFLFSLFLLNKQKTRYYLLPFIFLTGSKTIFLLLFVYVLILFCNDKVKKIITLLSLIFYLCYPLIIYSVYLSTNFEIKRYLTNITSHRFTIHYMYVDKSFNNLWGNGIVTNVNKFHNERQLEVVKFSSSAEIDLARGEQHSLPIEILYKFGIVVYAVYIFIMFNMRTGLDWKLGIILTNLLSVNGLYELITYVVISIMFVNRTNKIEIKVPV